MYWSSTTTGTYYIYDSALYAVYFFSLQIVSMIKVYIIPMTILLDIGLVVGFSVVSIPFLNLANPKYVNSTYSDRLQVKLLIHLNWPQAGNSIF